MTLSYQVHLSSRPACLFHLLPGKDIPLGQGCHHRPGFVEGTGSRYGSTLKCCFCQVQGKTNMALEIKGKSLLWPAQTSWACPPTTALPQLTSGSPCSPAVPYGRSHAAAATPCHRAFARAALSARHASPLYLVTPAAVSSGTPSLCSRQAYIPSTSSKYRGPLVQRAFPGCIFSFACGVFDR